MNVFYKGKKVQIRVRKSSFLGKALGLMFKSKYTKNILFEFEKERKWSIHSFFVFFNFLVLWIDEKNNVFQYNYVKPFTFSIKPERKCRKIIEIPISEKNRKIIGFFDGKRNI